jgi:hypothetical protein
MPEFKIYLDQMFNLDVAHFGDWIVLPLSRHPGVIRLKVDPT